MRSRARTVRLLALLLAGGLVLAGCAGRSRAPKGHPFPIPARPPSTAAPLRPTLRAGDVASCLLPGEVAPRICFQAGKWSEILRYIAALEAHQRSQGIRLRGHIEKLEVQIREMNRFLSGPAE